MASLCLHYRCTVSRAARADGSCPPTDSTRKHYVPLCTLVCYRDLVSSSTSTNEYNLPTPESITNPFGSSFAAAQTQNLGISPSEVTSLSSLKGRQSSSSLKEEKNGTGDPVSKQALLANEKRRRRRESHNAVERRRRDNINEKISELATLIPECMLDPSGKSSSFLYSFTFSFSFGRNHSLPVFYLYDVMSLSFVCLDLIYPNFSPNFEPEHRRRPVQPPKCYSSRFPNGPASKERSPGGSEHPYRRRGGKSQQGYDSAKIGGIYPVPATARERTGQSQ